MSTVTPIPKPLPGERVVALSPQDASAAATGWMRRPNLFAGRALTAATLQGRQRWQAGRIAQRGQAFTAGVARGLELNHVEDDEGAIRLLVEPGVGLSVAGEDVTLLQRLECGLRALPVALPREWFPQALRPESTGAVELTTLPGEPGMRIVGASLGALVDAAAPQLNRIGIVVLQPIQVDVSSVDPNDPCDRCTCGDDDDPAAVEDWRLSDGVRLVWYPWPEGWRPLPPTLLRLRNALAHVVFAAEAALGEGQALPWEELGVPLALMALDAQWKPAFGDRAAVARQGGRAREARLLVGAGGLLAASSRMPGLWQARIEQFAEQLAELGEPPPPAAQLGDPFQTLPPCGLLPRHALDLAAFRSDFFPPTITLDAVPVPIEQLDVALREAAALAPINLSSPERVRLLVPVTQASWERRLLKTEVIDPEFQRTLDRFLLVRSRELGARQGLRRKMAMLGHAIDGRSASVPAIEDDPLALEPESIRPWGPPPPGGGHRSAAIDGLHEHLFDSVAGSARLTLGAAESLFVWVHLDPDRPPRTLMFSLHANGSWEHRVFWGDDLIARGTLGSASRRRIDALPEAGQWVMLKATAAQLGLAGVPLDGMAFTLFDGRAAFGMCGAHGGSAWRKWFCNTLPEGARPGGSEPWELLSTNDLWIPFDARGGVLPSLLPLQPPQQPAGSEPLPLDSPLRLPASGFNLLYAPATGWRGHDIRLEDNAPGYLRLGADADGIRPKLLIAVYLDELAPPRSIVVSLETSNYEDPMAFWEHTVFWGENRMAELNRLVPRLLLRNEDATRGGALPPSSRWFWLEVTLPESIDTIGVYGLRVFAFGGEIALSDIVFGRAERSGNGWTLQPEPVWPRPRPGGDTSTVWQLLLGNGIGLRSGLGALTPTTTARTGVVEPYATLMDDEALKPLSGHERSQLLLRGVSGFADFLRRRIDRVDDITDFGFAHMQVDMHRLRNLMMTTTDASRLAVSPTIASIAKTDSAIVAQAQISEYLGKILPKRTTTAAAGVNPAAPAPATAATPRAAAAKATIAPNTVTSAVKLAQMQPATQLLRKPSAPEAIVFANPIVGLATVRTTAIADRLKQPPSTEARDYGLANRQRVVASLLALLRALQTEDSGEPPAAFVGFQVYGLQDDPFLDDLEGDARNRPLTDFLKKPALLERMLLPPVVSGLEDEALLYSQTVSLSDNTIAMLRQLEGRLAQYREALGRCEATLAQLQAFWSDATLRLAAVEERLAEARHDVGVTRALIAEELARIQAINDRRAAVLDKEVRFLAFVRPRSIDAVLAAPLRVVDPALTEAPVPACLRSHPELPDELAEMLKVVREAPAAWFPAVPAILDRLDRSELLMRTLRSARSRSALLAARESLATPTAGRIGNALTQVLARQAPLLAARLEAVARLDPERLAGSTWKGLRDQLRDVVSLGDLIDGEHGRGEVARLAAQEFDRIAGVCTCLHAEFSAVLPSIRLDWAELMSQFDAAPNLRELANLPRFAEIGSVDRRQMQAYADWIFAQVDPRVPQAEGLANDLVRMVLLLASHAPVGRIVAGRLPRPVHAVRPGVTLPLAALEPARLRVGMQALVYRDNAVVARAVVEDIGSDEVSARVLHVAAGIEELGTELRVHFDDATVVSAAPARSGGVFKRQA